ncbi:MAG: metallophosphoesterase family protein, partial [Tidjanibacter sp.]|nr:metallophosphoesterase family protein [Tidjanibacter sp.]
MLRVGVISDLHGTFDEPLKDFLAEVDEIWCAGDIGSEECARKMTAFGKRVVAVYGNIDDHTMRLTYPEWQCFEREGARILMTHIGFYGGRYVREVYAKICSLRPTIFVCGHSHILRVGYDKRFGVLNINPGAAGCNGFHSVRTAVRF